MTIPQPSMAPIRDVRFTRRIARQCSRRGRLLFDQAVCDAIANGSRRVVEPRGPGGGPVILFERPQPAGPGGQAGATVRVLGELNGTGCVALLLLSPLLPAKKSPKIQDF